jgi:hypothetical protein
VAGVRGRLEPLLPYLWSVRQCGASKRMTSSWHRLDDFEKVLIGRYTATGVLRALLSLSCVTEL